MELRQIEGDELHADALAQWLRHVGCGDAAFGYRRRLNPGARDGGEVAATEPSIRLERGALEPGVPGEDEDHALRLRRALCALQGRLQVALEELRAASGEDRAGAPPERRVVPTGEDDRNLPAGSGPGPEAPPCSALLLHRQLRQPATMPHEIPERERCRFARGARRRDGLPVQARPIELAVEAGRHPGSEAVLAADTGVLGLASGGQQERISSPVANRRIADGSEGRGRIRERPRLAHDEDRSARHPQVARIRERRGQKVGMREIVGARPDSGRVGGVGGAGKRLALVGPAEAERKVRLAGGEYLGERARVPPSPRVPVMKVAEGIDAVGARQVDLRQPHLRHAQVAVTQVRRGSGLLVPGKERPSLGQPLPGARHGGRPARRRLNLQTRDRSAADRGRRPWAGRGRAHSRVLAYRDC